MSVATLKKTRVRRVFQTHEKIYMKKYGFTVGIVGSRDWNNRGKVNEVIKSLMKKREGLCIVSGGADGADQIAKQLALHHGIPYKEFTPQHEEANKWTVQEGREFDKNYDPYHYFKRNAEIAKYVDLVIAFIPKKYVGDPQKAKGTKDTIEKAKDREDTKVMVLR